MQISGIDKRRGALAALTAGALGGLAAATIGDSDGLPLSPDAPQPG